MISETKTLFHKGRRDAGEHFTAMRRDASGGKTLEKKREIHALDYAVCAFLYHLNLLMWLGHLEGWVRPSGGLNLRVRQEVVGRIESAIVFVRPVSWPEPSHICLKLYLYAFQTGGSWHVIEGVIRRPGAPFDSLQFKVSGKVLAPDVAPADDQDSNKILGPVLERATRVLLRRSRVQVATT